MSFKRTSIAYGSALIINRAASFLLLPLLTSSLSPDLFGLLSVLQFTYMAALMFAIHGLDDASVRFCTSNDTNQRQFFKSTLTETSLFSVITLPILWGIITMFSTTESSIISLLIPLYLWVLADTVYIPTANICRANGKAAQVSAALIIQGLLTWILVWISLKYFNMGLSGILTAYALSSILPLPILLQGITSQTKSGATKSISFKDVRKYAIPAGIISLFTVGINFSDRYIIAKLGSTHDAGLYSVGFRLGMIVALAVSAFRMAWYPIAYKQLEDGHKKGMFQKESFKIILALSALALLVSFFRNEIAALTLFGKNIIAPEYHDGLSIIPIITLAFVFDGASTLADTALFYKQKMKLLLTITSIVLTIKVSLSILLLQFGIIGVALSSLIAFSLQTIIIEVTNRKYLSIQILGLKHFVLLALVSAAIFVSYI
ncbi:MAG: oligosaccharide flippase family protein [Fibrobacteres bacterium]|nr:oligosaccharide flippase family protein [Fibrobacterota bacterium]